MGKQLVRAKEVERRLAVARAAHGKDKREEKDRQRADADWPTAARALVDLEAAKFDLSALSRIQLQSLVRALKVGNANGKKDALKGLLVERFGALNRTQFDAIRAAVDRGGCRGGCASSPTGTSDSPCTKPRGHPRPHRPQWCGQPAARSHTGASGTEIE